MLDDIYRMTPQQLVQELVKRGMSKSQVAAYVGVSPQTIMRIASGEIKEPRYVIVDRLRELVR